MPINYEFLNDGKIILKIFTAIQIIIKQNISNQ